MRIQKLGRGFLITAAGCAAAFAQATGGTWNSMGSMAAPPPPAVRVSGKVALEDKSPPPSPAVIERVCDGLPHPEGTTDLKGNFAVDLGHDIIDDPYSVHIQPGVDMAPAEQDHPFNNCLIRASLPGYRSDLVPMANSKPEGHPYLGTIVLHSVGKATGWLISPTSLEAPKNALKDFDSAQQATRKNKQPEALQDYQKAVQVYPNYAAAWYEMGRLQAAAHKEDDARQSFNAAIKADPKYISPYLQLSALAFADEKWPELASVAGRLMELDSVDYPEAYFYTALANYHTRNLDVAEKAAREGIRIDVDHLFPQTYQLLASILVLRDQPAAALEQLEAYVRLFPRAGDLVSVQANIVQLKASLPKK